VKSALLESRYKPLVLLIELNANSGFWYKYTIAVALLADFHWLFGQGQRHMRRIDQRELIEQGNFYGAAALPALAI
jgi:hypothetical protein